MPEDNFCIGIVQDRFPGNPVDRIVVLPLMKWDEEKNIWTDLDNTRCRQLFPDKGLIVSFIDDTNLAEGQVIKFKVHQNARYIPGDPSRNAKFSIDRNQFYVLLELLILDFEGSEANLREAVLSGNLVCNYPHNSKCLIALGKERWLDFLTFKVNNPSRRLIPTDPENWRELKVRQIEKSDRIRPESLDSRVFVDPTRDFVKSVRLDNGVYFNWQPKANFIKNLINRLREHLEKLKSTHNTRPDLHELKNLIPDKAILHRLQEHDAMENLQKEDIDSIVQLLTAMEPFSSELKKVKEVTITKARQEAKAKAEQEVSNIRQEKDRIEEHVIKLRKEKTEIELTLETQRNRMNQTLDEFERLLNERLNQIVVEPSSVLAEALANDAFLQLIFGNYKKKAFI